MRISFLLSHLILFFCGLVGAVVPAPHIVADLFFPSPCRLQDGSEYLLRAPTQPLMNEWVSKLQQNSGEQPLLAEQGPSSMWLPCLFRPH